MEDWPENQKWHQRAGGLSTIMFSKHRSHSDMQEADQVSRSPAWMDREVLTELRCGMEVHRGWRQGWATWEDHRNFACCVGVGDQKAKVGQDLAFTGNVNGKKLCTSSLVAEGRLRELYAQDSVARGPDDDGH